jgi:hypothetical protein
VRKNGRVWQYNGIPFRLPRWTWRHTLCVRVLMFFGWPTWDAYTFARKHM